MSIRVSWPPSTDANVDHYLVQSGPGSAGPWTDIATVAHNLADALIYDAELNLFFFDDAAGTSLTWYRLAAVDAAAQQSPWSESFLPGETAAPAPTEYSADALLEDIRTRAMLPASNVTYTPARLLRLANSEMQDTVVPLVLSTREDYLVDSVDLPVAAALAIPRRAIGGKLRRLALVDGAGQEQHLERIQLEDLPASDQSGFYLQGNRARLVNVPQGLPTARLYFHRRPGRLVLLEQAGIVRTLNRANRTITFESYPPSWSAVATYDLIRATPSFDVLAADVAGTLSGGVLTLGSDLPDDLQAGDVIALAGESPVVQLPVELHPILAQAVAVKVLESLGDTQGLGMAQGKLKEAVANGLTLISERAEGNPRVVMPARRGAWRGRR